KILRKFGFIDVKSAGTPIETEKPLLNDPDGDDVDVHIYRLMIRSLMYLTSSKLDILFAICACARFQVTPKVSHLHAVKRIFRHLKGKPHLGWWYPRDSPFNMVAYSDSDYARASVNRKSTTGGCQFLGFRLISWQCKKQIVVSTSSTKAKYIAVVSCYAQVIWIQNQLLDYGMLHSKELANLKQTALDKDILNPFMTDASEGFDQIVDFLNAHVIQFVLMVNPTIYVSCIKQFWTSVSIKRSNDVVRLQALIDRKKVIITEDTIRQALRLDDAVGVDCLPNEEIFAKLARMGYEKPSTEGCIQTEGGGIAELDVDKGVTLVTAEEYMHADVKGRLEESQANPTEEEEEVIEVVLATKLLTEVVTTAATTITAAQVPKASAPRRRKGVVIQDPKKTATASVIMLSEVKSKDKGKGILIEESKPLKRQAHIEHDEAFARQLEVELNANINWGDVMDQVKRKEKQDNTVMRYQAFKENLPIFEKHYNSIQAFLEKGEKEIEEEGSKRKSESSEQRATKKQRIDEEEEELKAHLQIIVNDDDDVFTKATPLVLKVHVVDYQIYHENNKPFYKIIRANGTHKLFLSFITILKNFDREDLEML
nr:hypothetical protein [Tanacetum cinerariifolium]